MRIFKSFALAFSGILHCIHNERHMRIHTVVTIYVFCFSYFFHFTDVEYILLCLTVSSVLCAEVFNTAIEEITDLSSYGYNPLAKLSKDIAAGAVLLCSFFALVIGFVLFFRPQYYLDVFYFMLSPIWHLAVFVLLTILAILYIALGPAGFAQFFKLSRKKIKKD